MSASLEETLNQIAQDFDLLGDWEARFEHILTLAKTLAPLNDSDRTDDTRVRGCASQVWLVPEWRDQRLYFRGDSDAHLVKGLLALMLEIYSGRTPQEIFAAKPAEVFARLGLSGVLTPQRSNGLAALAEKIQTIARAHATP
jgi:cysteine desulfuration protein SufE